MSADKTTSTTKRGGNKQLHKALAQSGSRLVRTHNEMFGKWGYQLYQQTGHWKKSANAVARKLAVALYYMQLYGQPFSYEKYNLLKENVVLDIPVDILPSLNRDFKRYVRIPKENGILTTSELAKRYYKCEFKNFRGLGRKFFACLKDFVSNQRAYRERYNNLNHDSISFKQEDLQ